MTKAGLLAARHTVRTTSTGLAVDEPVRSWASHAADALRTLAEAEMVGMLPIAQALLPTSSACPM